MRTCSNIKLFGFKRLRKEELKMEELLTLAKLPGATRSNKRSLRIKKPTMRRKMFVCFMLHVADVPGANYN